MLLSCCQFVVLRSSLVFLCAYSLAPPGACYQKHSISVLTLCWGIHCCFPSAPVWFPFRFSPIMPVESSPVSVPVPAMSPTVQKTVPWANTAKARMLVQVLLDSFGPKERRRNWWYSSDPALLINLMGRGAGGKGTPLLHLVHFLVPGVTFPWLVPGVPGKLLWCAACCWARVCMGREGPVASLGLHLAYIICFHSCIHGMWGRGRGALGDLPLGTPVSCISVLGLTSCPRFPARQCLKYGPLSSPGRGPGGVPGSRLQPVPTLAVAGICELNQ